MKENDKAIHYLFWGIITAVIILSFFIIQNFIIALVSAFILAYLLKPIYNRLEKPLGKSWAAGITITSVLLIVLSTAGFIISTLASQIPQIVNQEFANKIIVSFENLPFQGIFQDYLPEIVSGARIFLLGMLSSILSEIPKRVIEIFVTFFATYYLLIDWENLKRRIKDLLPFKNKNSIMNQVEIVIEDILKGTLLLALIEMLIAAIGFLILGVPFAIFLAFLIGIFAFVPALGPLLVWVPVVLIELSLGNYTTAFGVLILGLILSSYIDNITRLKLIGKKSKIHPVVMIVGIFGGIALFGPMGFIIGPLILSILVTLMENAPKIEMTI